MLTLIERDDCLKLYPEVPLSDNEEEKYFYPKVFSSYILKADNADETNTIKRFTQLLIDLGFDELICMGDTDRAWLYFDGDGKADKAALQYFKDNGVGKKFNGALKVGVREMEEFMLQVFLITRFFAGLPIFNYVDTGKNIIGNICPDKSFHLSCFNEETDIRFNSLIGKSKGLLFLDTKC